MRRVAPRPLAAALERIGPDLSPVTTLALVQAVWSEVAGPAVAAEAEPVAEQGGVIVLQCASSLWAHELGLLSDDLTRRLNHALSRLGTGQRIDSIRASAAAPTRTR